jgi:hypothetical protein
MLPHILASCLAVFFVTCPPCITAHDLSALGDAQESRCIEGYCQLSTSVHGNDFTPACLPFVTRTTTTTMTTLVSTTGTLVTTLDGEATSSQLTLKPLSSSSGSTIGIGNQGDNGHQRLSTPTHQVTTGELSTQFAGQDTLSGAPCIGSYGCISSSVNLSASSVAQGSAARPPPISGTALLLTTTYGSNASCVQGAKTTGTSWNWLLTAAPTQPSFQASHSSRASRTGIGSNLVLVAALLGLTLI